MTATRPTSTPDFVGYPAARRGIRALLDGRPALHRHPVPACPEWTVTDLLAHLVEIAGRVLGRHGGTVPAAPAPDSTAPELLDRWDDVGRELDRRLAQAGGRSGDLMVMDAFTHELDLCAALGVAPPAEHVAQAPSLEVLVRGFSGEVTALGLPPLRVRSTDGLTWTAGEGRPEASVTAPARDLCRALAGRRSLAQLAAMEWSEAPGPWLPAFGWGPFTPPPSAGA
ncbi:maleylpyruvate isomerase family mycothiol-dependent enzyme [Amycolatopsis sp. OK19-0408]|uniref:Maleylpyruvate isomerase family mycothiol-dependent enzyme n=1 Tax=Amycolatopsis iheyensis TaxID=2945988 RepID=A0A9X2N7T6_9PSEU|nr:maleylpyruvate isomerase family mycothiol-dependent enzyme [Amycolatopsis iheyensis]MCR6483554.1 maleylpyruvate isomerase family mycothiol-dependent enzyme [Amycolatopsis iheyensis]